MDHWKKAGTDYDKTFYKQINDKSGTEYARISGSSLIEQYLPSAATFKDVFIKKADIPSLLSSSTFPTSLTWLDIHGTVNTERWDSPKLTQRTGWRLGKQKSFTWARLFDEVTTPKLVQKTGSNNILLQRSSSPDYRFWIQLPANGSKFDAFPTNIKTWAKTAVPRALKSAKEKDKTGKWVFDKPTNWNKYVFLSRSPFHLFDTWIHEDDLKTYLASCPDENFPDESQVKAAEKVLSDNQQSKGYFFSDSLKTKVQKKISVVEQEATEYSVAHPDGELVWTKISTDTMQAPFQKTTRPYDQAATMGGTSAPMFAKQLGWKGSAEWLHLSGYAWGGLASMFDGGSKATLASSQQPFNFCIGTEQCNTHMLRWEKAWQNLFHKEKSLATTAITGDLMVCNNMAIDVLQPRRAGDGSYPRNKTPIKFEDYVDTIHNWSLAKAWNMLGCLVFVMEYQVTLEGDSKILGVKSPSSDIRFHPFRRQLTTKTECLMDDVLFEELLAAAKA